jgi:hypothetical protein
MGDDTRLTEDTAHATPADEPETSAVDCPTRAADPTALAWSLDDGSDEPQRQSWRSVWGVVAVIGVCGALIASVLAWVAGQVVSHPTIAGHPTMAPTTQAAPAPGSTFAVPSPAPTLTVTQTVTPAPAQPTASDAANDQLFLQRLQTDGFNNNSPEMAGYAHMVCNDLQQGKSETQVVQWLSAGPLLGMGREWLALFVNDAKVSYPNCAAKVEIPPAAPAPAAPSGPAPSGPCYYSAATPECPPKGLTPEQRDNY